LTETRQAGNLSPSPLKTNREAHAERIWLGGKLLEHALLWNIVPTGGDEMDKIPMTVGGHKALTAEFEHRTANERRRIIDAIAEARAHGDLSENAEYSAAKEQQSLNEGRIKELETILALADIIDVSKLTGDSVKFGATVTFLDEDTEEEKTYQVVGDPEADASAGRISISSPIARAMIGKSEGDSFEVAAPGGARSYEIIKIKYV
jgi:transcription elongation factor GreA